jgi:hypothetical protein
MSQEQPAIGYDQFFFKPVKERIKIFNEISAENRAFLVKTQAERWLSANRSRLTHEQVTIVEELIQSVSPEWYKKNRNFDEIEPEAEVLIRKVEAVLSREDVMELATERAKYIPAVSIEQKSVM